MSDKQIVSYSPALARTIPHRTLGTITRPSGGELTHVVPKDAAAPGLVESNPVFDFRSHGLEDHTRVASKVSDKLLLVQESAVALVQRIRQVPVKESN